MAETPDSSFSFLDADTTAPPGPPSKEVPVPPDTVQDARAWRIRSVVDGLAADMSLKDRQISILYDLALCATNLSFADIQFRLCNQATLFQVLNVVGEMESPTGHLRSMVGSLEKALKIQWKITGPQKNAIRRLVQGLLLQPKRSSYRNLHTDVLKTIRDKSTNGQDGYGLACVFDNVVDEGNLTKEIRAIASSERSHFREKIRDTVFGRANGGASESLDGACLSIALKYGMDVEDITQKFKTKIAIFRRFARENPDLLLTVTEIDEDLGEDDEADRNENPGPKKRTRQVNHGKAGRPKTGEDFWAKLEAYNEKLRGDLGDSWSSLKWQEWIKELFRDEDEIHPHSKGKGVASESRGYQARLTPALHSVPPSPATPTPSPAPSALRNSLFSNHFGGRGADNAALQSPSIGEYDDSESGVTDISHFSSQASNVINMALGRPYTLNGRTIDGIPANYFTGGRQVLNPIGNLSPDATAATTMRGKQVAPGPPFTGGYNFGAKDVLGAPQ